MVKSDKKDSNKEKKQAKDMKRVEARARGLKELETGTLVFPEKGDPLFGDKLMSLKEFQVFAPPPLEPIKSAAEFEQHVDRACGGFEKAIYQHLMQHFLSRRSPYKSLLLYHFLGVGKSCSAITIAEALLLDHTEHEEPRIIVVSPAALRKNFEEELFASIKFLNMESIKNQCTGNTYQRLVHGLGSDEKTRREGTGRDGTGGREGAGRRASMVKRIQQIIKSRYMFVTYAGLTALATADAKQISDKVFIVDEAHNLRENDTAKASAEALKHIIQRGKRNRLVLLSATPMYNEPNEIFWLLSLLLLNDKRSAEASSLEKLHLFKNSEPSAAAFRMLQALSTEYISYIRGNNPFTFPARLRPVTGVLVEPWTQDMRDGITVTEAGDLQQIHMMHPSQVVKGADDEYVEDVDEAFVGKEKEKIGGAGCYKHKKAECILEPDCEWIVGKGCRSKGSERDERGEREERGESGKNDGKKVKQTKHTNKDTQASALEAKSSVVQLQLSNITYPGNKSGSAGFFEVFSKVDDVKPLQVSYRTRDPGARALVPNDTNLGRIAAKIQRICDTIRTSNGIVVVYSQFVWSGVVPCAIALEHMGFRRHGARQMLKSTDAGAGAGAGAVDGVQLVTYPGIVAPTYCIFSGSDAVMGSTRIEEMMDILNSKKNTNGQQIKVVLMTPIAGEGLSFKNVREMHVLEPWYHFNKIDQVVGRAIRTCSHKTLPQEERNVTVYLHACRNRKDGERKGDKKGDAKDKDRVSPDIHAYMISARKLYETRRAEETIRDNAIDCALLQNVNYYPSDLFQYAVAMHTSQNQVVPYKYGENEGEGAREGEVSSKPVCAHPVPTVADARSMRPDIFETLVGTMVSRLEKHIRTHLKGASQAFFTVDDLLAVLSKVTVDKSVGMTAITRILHPAVLLRGHRIIAHMNGVAVVPDNVVTHPMMVSLPNAQLANPAVKDVCDVDGLISTIRAAMMNTYIGTYNAYLSVNSACWQPLARTLVGTASGERANIDAVAELFQRTGALVAATELPRISVANHKFVGYVDIFDVNKFVVVLRDGASFREASDAEIATIKSKRVAQHRPKSATQLFGVMEPTVFKKQPNEPITNQLKLIGTDPKTPITKGAACNTKTKGEIEGFLKAVGVDTNSYDAKIKEQMCFTLAIELLKQNRMFMYPEWKPAGNKN